MSILTTKYDPDGTRELNKPVCSGRITVDLDDGTQISCRLTYFENPSGTDSDMIQRIERLIERERPGRTWTSIEGN